MSPFDDSIGSMMFNVIPIIVVFGFVFVFAIIALNVVRSIKTMRYNNAQPVLSVVAKIVSKRTNVSSNSHINNTGDFPQNHNHTYTTYYATFEVESGDRLEFSVKGNEFGMLVEGDVGKLTFQGSRYLGFQRKQPNAGK